MKKIMLTAVATASLVALPVAGANAKKGGHGESKHGQAESNHGKAKKCSKTQSKGFVVKGSLASFTPDDVTLTVTRANPHARGFVQDNAATFPLADARLKFEGVTDGNASGAVDLADVLPTDKVSVTGKVTTPKKGCMGDKSLSVRKIQVERPEAEAEAPDTED